jgi:hypothetical protein
MIPHVKAVLDGARQNQLTAAGFIQRSANAVAVGNKAGLVRLSHVHRFEPDQHHAHAGGASSGWASQTSVSLKDVNGEAAGRVSAEKCLRGAGKRARSSIRASIP